jgi:hypothetical protein
MYRKDKYAYTLDGDEECDEECLDAFRHLHTFQRILTNVRCLDAEETTAMINAYQHLIDEGNKRELRISAEFSKKVIAVKVLSGNATLPKKSCKIKGF